MKKYLLALTLLMASSAFGQTPTLTAPQVLGCISPAPAVPPAPTVFISSCKTPAFLPTNTTSVIGSVSKTVPVFAHTMSGYKATDLVVACPIGATVSGSSCTSGGKDVSALVAESAVSSFSIAPAAPTVTNFAAISWTPPTTNDDGTPITNLTGFNVYQDQVFLGTVPVGTNSFILGTLNVGQTYNFGVTAINSDGISSVQTVNIFTVPSVTPILKTPSAPTGVTVTVK